jgi:hypothetical protein
MLPSVTKSPATDVPLPNMASRAVRTDGAFVFRGRVPGGLLMIDFDRERTLLVGNTAAQLADICSTGVLPEQVTEHDVFTPNGVLHVLIQAGTLPAVVYPPVQRRAKYRNVILPDGTIKLPVIDIIVR